MWVQPWSWEPRSDPQPPEEEPAWHCLAGFVLSSELLQPTKGESYPWCNGLTSPSLLISNLDFSGTGGNLDTQTNITIFTPPGTNQVISDGSYRLTTTDDGEAKLEISFLKDEGNFVNGFISLPASEAD